MNKKTVIEKIKKCLALSKSANQHEAAAALRQAMAFMEKYKISNMKSEINQVMLRIISHEKPVGNAVRVEASLEDVFLYYFGEKAGDENAAL